MAERMGSLHAELIKRLQEEHATIDEGYIDLNRGQSYLDGWFTAPALRAIADAMDKLPKESFNAEV